MPFHTWTPDVYQGSPTPVTGFMAAAAKAAGFAGLLRVFVFAFGPLKDDWRPAVWALADAHAGVGSVLAVVQTDVKRMLAYTRSATLATCSSGSGRPARAAATHRGCDRREYYLLTYGIIVLGSFAVVSVVGGVGDGATASSDYRGLSVRKPALAVSLTLLLAAQAGVPFTTGSSPKFSVIKAALGGTTDRGLGVVLALIAMLVTAVGGFFYLRLILTMFQPPEGADDEHGGDGGSVAVLAARRTELAIPVGTGIALAVSLLMTIGAGLWAGPLLDFAARALGR